MIEPEEVNTGNDGEELEPGQCQEEDPPLPPPPTDDFQEQPQQDVSMADDDFDGDDSNESEDDYDDDSEPEESFSYVDDMLEKNVDVESLKKPAPSSSGPKRIAGKKRKRNDSGGQRQSRVETKQKNVLIKRGHDLFEILPEGWVEITHFSGMPIYLHKMSRVCTAAKPYLLGTGSARKHHIPISAIPCLQYKMELEKEEKIRKEKEQQQQQQQTEESTDVQKQEENQQTTKIQPIAKVETLEENKREKSLHYNKVREYCKNLFEFKTVTVKKFTNWAERRKHEQSKKLAARSSLPESTKLITCTIPKNVIGNNLPGGKSFKKEFIMNPAGKSHVCILHEFVQHMERTQPKYVFEELENGAKPYCATVIINNVEYGKGYGSSKKEAKTEAARASLNVLIPDLKNNTGTQDGQTKSDLSSDLDFFDDIGIEDQRVSELCMKAGQFSPYQILVECIKRLYGFEDITDIKTEVKLLRHQKIEFKMIVGTHQAVVICKNKREGKQRAAQKILRSIHPQLKSWGALLKLYGQGSFKTSKEKKEEAQKITELQNKACSNRPNYAILNKLKEEMLKLNGKVDQQSNSGSHFHQILLNNHHEQSQLTSVVGPSSLMSGNSNSI